MPFSFRIAGGLAVACFLWVGSAHAQEAQTPGVSPVSAPGSVNVDTSVNRGEALSVGGRTSASLPLSSGNRAFTSSRPIMLDATLLQIGPHVAILHVDGAAATAILQVPLPLCTFRHGNDLLTYGNLVVGRRLNLTVHPFIGLLATLTNQQITVQTRYGDVVLPSSLCAADDLTHSQAFSRQADGRVAVTSVGAALHAEAAKSGQALANLPQGAVVLTDRNDAFAPGTETPDVSAPGQSLNVPPLRLSGRVVRLFSDAVEVNHKGTVVRLPSALAAFTVRYNSAAMEGNYVGLPRQNGGGVWPQLNQAALEDLTVGENVHVRVRGFSGTLTAIRGGCLAVQTIDGEITVPGWALSGAYRAHTFVNVRNADGKPGRISLDEALRTSSAVLPVTP